MRDLTGASNGGNNKKLSHLCSTPLVKQLLIRKFGPFGPFKNNPNRSQREERKQESRAPKYEQAESSVDMADSPDLDKDVKINQIYIYLKLSDIN